MIVSFSPLSATSPKCGMFGIPYLINGFVHLNKVWDSDIGDEIRADLSSVGIRALGVLDFAIGRLPTSAPSKTPEDLKGIILRVMQSDIQIKAWETLGATPSPWWSPRCSAPSRPAPFRGQENPVNAIYSKASHETVQSISLHDRVTLCPPCCWPSEVRLEQDERVSAAGPLLAAVTLPGPTPPNVRRIHR